MDTNVLLRLREGGSPDRARCRATVDRLIAAGDELCVCAQVQIEYWGVATRPVEANGLGLSPEDAEADLRMMDEYTEVLAEPPDAASRWRRIAAQKGVRGKQVHDARLAMLMLAHGVEHILTLNVADLSRFDGVTAIEPREA